MDFTRSKVVHVKAEVGRQKIAFLFDTDNIQPKRNCTAPRCRDIN